MYFTNHCENFQWQKYWWLFGAIYSDRVICLDLVYKQIIKSQRFFFNENSVHYLTDASLKPIGVATTVVKSPGTWQWCNQLEWDLLAQWLSWELMLVPLRSGPILYPWLNRVLANGKIPYTSNVYFHWLRPWSAIDRKRAQVPLQEICW